MKRKERKNTIKSKETNKRKERREGKGEKE